MHVVENALSKLYYLYIYIVVRLSTIKKIKIFSVYKMIRELQLFFFFKVFSSIVGVITIINLNVVSTAAVEFSHTISTGVFRFKSIYI